MLVTFFKRGGKGDTSKARGGDGAKDYLLGKDEDREHARVLAGDPKITTEVINGLDTAKTYTSGVLAFEYSEGDKLTEDQKQEIIKSFEYALFPNLEPDQFTGYWVEHTDKINEDGENRLELNFVYANVDLRSGKTLTVYYHDIDMPLVDSWRDVTNARYGLTDPNAPEKAQILTPAKNIPALKEVKRSAIHDLVVKDIELGIITDRASLVDSLQGHGLEVARQDRKAISIKDPDGGQNIRMKGEIYEREFTIERFISKRIPKGEQEKSANIKRDQLLRIINDISESKEHSSIDGAAARRKLQSCLRSRQARLDKRHETVKEIPRDELTSFIRAFGAAPTPPKPVGEYMQSGAEPTQRIRTPNEASPFTPPKPKPPTAKRSDPAIEDANDNNDTDRLDPPAAAWGRPNTDRTIQGLANASNSHTIDNHSDRNNDGGNPINRIWKDPTVDDRKEIEDKKEIKEKKEIVSNVSTIENLREQGRASGLIPDDMTRVEKIEPRKEPETPKPQPYRSPRP